MKRLLLLAYLVFFNYQILGSVKSWIRINQLGYQSKSVKVAVLISKEELKPNSFTINSALTDEIVYRGSKIKAFGEFGSFASSFRLNFSDFTKEGAYYLKVGDIKSPTFKISNDVYDGTADFLLRYMRQQRCGFNPLLNDSCHTQDGFIIYHPTLDSTFIDVIGGWHDASDYLQYVTTSANAVFQMLFAYQQNPSVFKDEYDKDGKKGANGIPDILDEAKWGLDWLVKMNPTSEMMFNQIADDRDHRGFRLPNDDTITYADGKGLQRPVYFIDGKPQGVFKYKNRTNGVASTAGKFSSAFALGSEILKKYYPEFSEVIKKKSFDAFDFGMKYPGVCQTAPCRAPYFYEEDNWVDDMELAGIQLFNLTSDEKYLEYAVKFGDSEPVTPWMGSDTARHYQWYPFLNLGHFFLTQTSNKNISKKFINFLKEGIEKVYLRAKDNPFMIGIPFIWCSNNLISALLTQIRLFSKVSKDNKYDEMEASLRDWLFGCNPWGTSMIIGLPKNGDYPSDPHSAFTRLGGYSIDGGLVDGPVYSSIYNNLIGIKLYAEDEYKEFQSDFVVYHDDYGDYSTNEPTMDGTASLTFYLSSLEANKTFKTELINAETNAGGIYRFDKSRKQIFLVFTGHEFADGGEHIRKTLKKHRVKASFFFTGDFYRNSDFKNIIKGLINDEHYLGAHSDKHLLYSDWIKRDSTLISKEEFIGDLKNNYKEMKKFGISPKQAKYFLPPFEWYNQEISGWTSELGLKLINFTPGTSSNADYTIPTMNNYVSSDMIFKKIIDYEEQDKFGLNGFILLMHIGTHPARKDKFYFKLDSLISILKSKGYEFKKLK